MENSTKSLKAKRDWDTKSGGRRQEQAAGGRRQDTGDVRGERINDGI